MTTDAAFIESFLHEWLVKRDVGAARRFLREDFFIMGDDASQWPSNVASLPATDRALQFGLTCQGTPSSCATLSECIRPTAGQPGSALVDFEKKNVTAQMVKENPQLRSALGTEIVTASFVLRGCNLGVLILADGRGNSQRRVRAIMFLAG